MSATLTNKSRLRWASIVAAFALLISHPLHAQQYVFDTYQQERGLSNLSTKDVAFDRDGFLWIATENGLFRLVGSHFDRFGPEQGLLERDVNRVYSDPSGRLWAATDVNLYRWDGYRFAPAAKTPFAMHLNESMEAISPDRFLVQSRYRLYELTLDATGNVTSSRPYFSAEEVRSQPDLQRVISHVRVPDGMLWLGLNGKIESYRDGKVRSWGVQEGVPADLWLTLHLDRQGSLWAVSQKHVIVLPANHARFEDRTPRDTDAGGVFRSLPIVEDREGRIFVDAASGISRWDGRAWHTIGPANGFTSSHITCMTIDREGDPWLGSIGIGLIHWTGYEHWEAWTDQQGLPSSVTWSIASAADGGELIGTTKGPARLSPDHSRLEPLGGPGKWPYGQVSGILQDRLGTIWMTTFAGWVLRLPPGPHAAVQPVSQITRYIIYGLVADGDGNLWMNSVDGIDEISGSSAHATLNHNKELDSVLAKGTRKTRSLIPILRGGGGSDRGSVWLMAGTRLLHAVHGVWSTATIEGSDSLAKSEILDMNAAPDGSVWLYGLDETDHNALWHLTPQGTAPTLTLHATPIQLPQGLRDLSPMTVHVDRRGWVWLATDVGLDAWNGTDWRHLSHESGLVWNDSDSGVMVEDPDGSLWLGTSGGAAHLLQPETIFNEAPLSVEITSMSRGDRNLSPQSPNQLPYAGPPILFEFATPTFLDRSDLMFRYRIADLQSDWVSTPDAQAAFTSLRPGQHHFEVSAYNRNTGEQSSVAEAVFVILPRWWETTWFFVACAFAVCLVVWLFTRLRTRQLLVRQQQLERLIDERTAELKKSQEGLRKLALYDELTGLFNRRAILERLAGERDRARRDQIQVAVLLIDIDHFKQINDTHGHLAGDEALRKFGEKLAQVVRPYDYAGRYGGEEFLLILSNLPDESITSRLTQLHASVTGMRVPYDGTDLTFNCSMGAVRALRGGTCIAATELLSLADRALYSAKTNGRNRIVFAEGDNSSAPPIVAADAN